MLKDLIRVANKLDEKGLSAEADHLDYVIKKIAQESSVPGTGIRLEKGDPYEYWLSADKKSFTARHTDTGKTVGPFRNQEVIDKLISKSPKEGPALSAEESGIGQPFQADAAAIKLALQAFSSAVALIAPAAQAAPLPIYFLIQFLAQRTDPYTITSPDLRRAMHHVVNSGDKRSVSYSNYQKGQVLDPERKAVTAPTYGYGSAASVAKSYDPYSQLSLGMGGASVRGGSDQDGYQVTDIYDFNLNRDKSQVREVSQYIATIPNIQAMIKRIQAGMEGKGEDSVGGGLVGYIEEILVMYETTLGYKGFPVSINTIPPKAQLGLTDRMRDIYS